MFNQDKRQIYHSEHYGLLYTDGIEPLNANGIISGGKELFIKDIPQNADTTYAKALLDVLNYGAEKGDRTGTGTGSLFGYQMRFSLLNEFPLLTTKKIHWKSVVGELLWFLSGCKGGVTGLQEDYGVTIWNEWQSGKIAYSNMVKWGESDLNQLANIIAEIKTNPDSRRLLVSNWNPKEVHGKEILNQIKTTKNEHLGIESQTLDLTVVVLETKLVEQIGCWSHLAVTSDDYLVSFLSKNKLLESKQVAKIRGNIKKHAQHWKTKTAETQLNYVKVVDNSLDWQ
jgi:hypothetical protein